MVRCADYIWNNIIIADEVNTTKKYAKKAQCGVDLSVKSLKRFTDMGYTLKDKTFAAPTKEVEKVAVTAPNGNVVYGYKLEPGTYALELNEGCKLGPNDTAYVIMRSSLNRSGAHCHSALWDPQFTTQSGDNIYSMNIRMTVDNQHGFFIEENARVAQIVVFENEDTEGYDGQWQGGATVSKLV